MYKEKEAGGQRGVKEEEGGEEEGSERCTIYVSSNRKKSE